MKTILLASVATAITTAFMSETTEVVLAEGKNGPVRVNRDEFEADQAEGGAKLYKPYKGKEEPVQSQVEPTAAPAEQPPAPTAIASDENQPAQTAFLVEKQGTGKNAKFIVTDSNGAAITGLAGIDESGYADEKTAWDAIMALPR